MSNRRDFLKQSLYTGTGLMLPSYLFWGCGDSESTSSSGNSASRSSRPIPRVSQAGMFGGVSQVAGYLIPILIEKGVKQLFDAFGTGSSSDTPKSIVDQSITIISNGAYEVSKVYDEHYKKIVRPKLGSEKLNGVGLYEEDPKIKSRMNDMGSKATSPLHSVKDLDNFNHDLWNKYCDLSDLQSDDSGRVYVTPRDKRPDEWKDTFYVHQELAFMLYNPLYYCHGLPIENPQRHDINEQMKKDIYQQTGLQTSKNVFYKQRFFYQGDNCGKLKSTIPESIIYGTDEALNKYYNVITMKPCGDW